LLYWYRFFSVFDISDHCNLLHSIATVCIPFHPEVATSGDAGHRIHQTSDARPEVIFHIAISVLR